MSKESINLKLTPDQAKVLQTFIDSGCDGIITLRNATGGKITLAHVAMNAALSHVAMNAALSHVAMNAALSHVAMNSPLKPAK